MWWPVTCPSFQWDHMEGTLLSGTLHTCGSTQTGGTFAPGREREETLHRRRSERKESVGSGPGWGQDFRKGSANTPVGSRGLGLVEEDHTQGRRKTTAEGRLQQEGGYSKGTHTPTPVGASGRSRGSGCSGGSGCSWDQCEPLPEDLE